MKYIDADKIRTEIKRLKAENNCGTDEFIAAKDIAYDKVFDFLENLEEPVTDCHDLTEAAENPYVLNDVSHAAFEYERTRNDLDARSDNEVVRRAFIAGAEWGAEHLAGVRKMISDDLEEAAEKYAEDEMMAGLAERAFKAGAEWMKKQIPTPEDTVLFQKGVEEGKRLMMEDAVEGVVMDFSSNQPRPQVDVLLDPHKYHTGDKVKIIIVKEDKK